MQRRGPQDQCRRSRWRNRGSALALAVLTVVSLGKGAGAEVQLRCDGTLLEARGSVERQRPLARIGFSLGLESRAAGAAPALAQLQQRLAAVRSALVRLGVEELRVGSPSTWSRPAGAGQRESVQSELAVTGVLPPERLQALIREVGSLAGVRLAPVKALADPAAAAAERTSMLAAAYRDAEAQVLPLAQLIGRPLLRPLQIQVDGGSAPVMMRAEMAPAPAPPFDPQELDLPSERLSMQVQFCAVRQER
jgi:uncharacterized protein YggE